MCAPKSSIALTGASSSLISSSCWRSSACFHVCLSICRSINLFDQKVYCLYIKFREKVCLPACLFFWFLLAHRISVPEEQVVWGRVTVSTGFENLWEHGKDPVVLNFHPVVLKAVPIPPNHVSMSTIYSINSMRVVCV